MPRRALTPEEEAAERAAMGGFPNDGDEFEGAPPNPAPAPAPAPQPDPMVDVRARMDRLERENQDLRRMIPPAAPKPTPALTEQGDEFDAVDWDKELFANPKDALKKAMTMTAVSVEKKLRAEYQRDRGTSQFWDKFYAKHPDLRDDHDLVEVTLNSNLPDLANIRVDDAYTRLAELTRERILRYTGGAVRKNPKARAEGGSGGPPVGGAPAPKQDEVKVTSLSQFVRSRREKRRAGAA